jgi:hypothetical protein
VKGGRTDLAFVRLLATDPKLDGQLVATESRVVAVPADSRLALERTIEIDRLGGHRRVASPVEVLPAQIAAAFGSTDGGAVLTVEDCLAAVAAGGVALLPDSVARCYPRPHVAYVAAPGAGTSAVFLVSRPLNLGPAAASLLTLMRRMHPFLHKTTTLPAETPGDAILRETRRARSGAGVSRREAAYRRLDTKARRAGESATPPDIAS